MANQPKLPKRQFDVEQGDFVLPTNDILINPHTTIPLGKSTLFPVGARGVPAAGRHWYSTGPNNLGGRIRCMAIDPHDDRTLYAGSASGGIFKTTDGGEVWKPVFRAEPSLGIGAIAIAATSPTETVIYVATGEPTQSLTGGGILRSTDHGESWTPIATAEQLNDSFEIEQIAVHPNEPEHVWVVSKRGVFRTLDGRGAAVFERFADELPTQLPVYYSDVAFGAGPATGGFHVYLVRARTEQGEIVRLDSPRDANADIVADLRRAGNRKRVFGAAGVPPGEPVTMRGKITISRSTPAVAYVAFVQLESRHENGDFETALRQIRRSTNANTGGADNFQSTDWNPMPDPERTGGQGEYNLCIGVSPTDPDHVFFGMVNMFFCTNGRAGTPVWHLAIPAALFRTERSAHADQHAIVFENGAGSPVWVGNDGGVVRCDNYRAVTAFIAEPTPTPARDLRRSDVPAVNGIRWQQHVHGLVAAQAYDLTQSPLVATMYGSGHQDNGVWYTAGGATWRRVMRADGGFVAWDPVDPYHFYATWQSGLDTMTFPGAWETTVPAPNLNVTDFLWPRELNQGFHPLDGSRFVADTVHHPRAPGRVVTTRRRRAYATRDGERFTALPIGDVVELVAKHEHPQPGTPDPRGNDFVDGMVMLEVIGGTAGPALGLFRSLNFSTNNVTQNATRLQDPPNPTAPSRAFATNLTTLRGLRRGPFTLTDGQTLELRARCRDRGPTTGPGDEQERLLPVVTFRTGDFVDISRATADEVARVITAALAPIAIGARRLTVEARPVFHGGTDTVVVFTEALGAGATLQFRGTATLLTALGLHDQVIHGTDGRPALMTLQTQRQDNPRFPPGNMDVGTAVGEELRIDVDGTGDVTITVAADTFADLTAIRADELADVINRALVAGGKHARAEATSLAMEVVVFRADAAVTPGAPAGAPSTALPRMTEGNVPSGRARAFDNLERELTFVPRALVNAFDLFTGAPLTLRLTSQIAAAVSNVDIVFDAAGFADRHRASVDEVVQKIRGSIPAARRLRCEVRSLVGVGAPSEIAYAAAVEPAHLWVGGGDGQIWKSTDDGNSWREVGDPRMKRLGRGVEAITVHPTNADIVYVGLGGRRSGDRDPGALWKTDNGGTNWSPIGLAALPVAGDVALVEVDAAGVAISPRRVLGITEVVIDPANPRRFWVATFAGVFESEDEGFSFKPMSEGLPHGRVMDLALVPGARRMLRCTVWGRGAFARDVGAEPTPDIQLYVRNSLLDDGGVRPADDGLDGFSTFPLQITRWESPDIKVSRLPYSDLGTADQIGAADFDEELISEPVGQHTSGTANDEVGIFVLVHNRSERAPGDTRVIALWADCTEGVPRLPADLYTTINAGPTVSGTAWSLAGVGTITGGPTAFRPRTVRIPFTPPDDVGVTKRAIGILVLVDTAAARVTAGPLTVRELLATERRAGFRLVPTRTARENDQPILRALDGVPFTVAEPTPVPLGLVVGAPGVTHQRGAVMAAPVDISGGAARVLTVTTVPVAPATPTTVTITFRPAELTALGLNPAAMTVPMFRRFINRQLRLGPVGVRCVAERAELSVRAEGLTADLIAAATAFAAPELDNAASAIASGAWLTLGSLTRSTTNHIYARVRNTGGAIEPLVTWRAFWFDPAAASLDLDGAHELGTGTIPNLAPGASQVMAVTHDPGAAAGVTQRGVLIWAHSDGDPVHAPAAEPVPGGAHFTGIAELDQQAARHPNLAYRILTVV